jgi:internalin A
MEERTIRTKKELNQVLKQAAQERWTDLALVRQMSGDEKLPEDTQAEHKFWIHGVDVRLALQQISKLTSLTSLDLSRNSIGNEEAKALSKLTTLSHLELSNNSLGDEGAVALSSLANLDYLYLFNNEIEDEGAKALSALTTLSSLELSSNNIKDEGAKALSKLTNLTSLGLSRNIIGDEGAKALSTLTKLTSLELSSNRIGPEGAKILSKQTKLSTLDLSGNRLGDEGCRMVLEAFLDNKKIRFLGLGYNNTTEQFLSKEVLNQTDAKKLLAAYRGYKEAKEKGQLKPLNEVKLLIVGNEAVGKTSLVRALVEGKTRNTNEPPTPGIAFQKIETRQWKADSEFTINIWDFGGQEVMHGTHRFFLTSRSLYLIVLEDRRHDDRSVYDWLKTIRNRAENVPIIVVINKCDTAIKGLHLDETSLKESFPSIVDFVRVSCNEGKQDTIEKLKQLILKTIQQDERLKEIRNPIPDSWRQVKEALAKEAKLKKKLREKEFADLCEKASTSTITNEDEQHSLRQLLHDLGVIILYEENAAQKEIKLLDPNWLTAAIYTLLNHHKIKENSAIFTRGMLSELLDPTEYKTDDYEYIIAMMQRPELGLCFRLASPGEQFLLPEALTKNKPAPELLRGWDDALLFRYLYSYLPEGLIPRLIVEAHLFLTEPRTVWRTGAIFRILDCPILVQGNTDPKQLDFKIVGLPKKRRDALEILLKMLGEVHKPHKELGEKAVVPLPDNPQICVSYEHLLRLEKMDGPSGLFLPDGAERKYRVHELLEGVRVEREVLSRSIRPQEANHFLDEAPLDWTKQNVQDLCKLLSQAYDNQNEIEGLLQQIAGLNTSALNFIGNPQGIWRDVMKNTSKRGCLRALIELALQDPSVRAFHQRIKVICGM